MLLTQLKYYNLPSMLLRDDILNDILDILDVVLCEHEKIF